MKKATILAILALASLSCVLAASGGFGFGIGWRVTNNNSTTISLLAPDGSDLSIGESGHKEQTLEVLPEEQDAFKLRIHTNESRRHSFLFQMTPFVSGNNAKAGYRIRFMLNDQTLGIQNEGICYVGNDAELYPLPGERFGAEFNLSNLAGFVDIDIDFYILFSDSANMSGIMSSTITITEEAQ